MLTRFLIFSFRNGLKKLIKAWSIRGELITCIWATRSGYAACNQNRGTFLFNALHDPCECFLAKCKIFRFLANLVEYDTDLSRAWYNAVADIIMYVYAYLY